MDDEWIFIGIIFAIVLCAGVAIVFAGNLTGPTGPQGIQGLQGIQGNQGIQGLRGYNGTSVIANHIDWINITSIPNLVINGSSNYFMGKVNYSQILNKPSNFPTSSSYISDWGMYINQAVLTSSSPSFTGITITKTTTGLIAGLYGSSTSYGFGLRETASHAVDLEFNPNTDATSTGYINFYGYNGGTSRARDIYIGNGKGAYGIYITYSSPYTYVYLSNYLLPNGDNSGSIGGSGGGYWNGMYTYLLEAKTSIKIGTTYKITSTGLVADNKIADSAKWGGNTFTDYLDQAVKTTSSPSFVKITATIVTTYQSGDYAIDWSTISLPTGTNGMMVIAYNSNAGVLSSREYIYTNSAWHYIVIV